MIVTIRHHRNLGRAKNEACIKPGTLQSHGGPDFGVAGVGGLPIMTAGPCVSLPRFGWAGGKTRSAGASAV
jgi:hypothetical protein